MRVPLWLRRTAVAAGVGIGTAGLLAGVLLLGPLAASVLLAVVFALIWPLAAVIKHLADESPYGSPSLIAAAAAGAVLAVPGLAHLLGGGAIGVLIVLIAAIVFVLVDLALPDTRRERRPWRRRRRRDPEYGDLEQGDLEHGELTHEDHLADEKLIASLQCPLSIEELCGVWGETSKTLAHGAGPRDRQAVAEVRRICLDEFERRNPDGFHRWLDAGAPANPGAYLLP
ncbi:hypothetical protein AB0P21_37585 [Kribbella sp. NPDC056861]|uniref:hypothetical protein n=1 Tax=Kribbella sp. NPDC056861 TaxID=3154857 RepID=UPI003421F774